MNRRGFIQSLGTLVGGVLLDKAIPFNRVWSFPSKIVIPQSTPTTYSLGSRISWVLLDDWSDSDDYSVIHTPYLTADPYALIVKTTEKQKIQQVINGILSQGNRITTDISQKSKFRFSNI